MFCLSSLVVFQEKSCYLWKVVLVSMFKMHIRTWPTPAMGSLGTSFIHFCWFSRTQMPGLALEAIGQDDLRKVWQKSSAVQYMALLLISFDLAQLQFTSTGISCCFSSYTTYARTNVSFMFKLFCYQNLLSWNGDWTIGRRGGGRGAETRPAASTFLWPAFSGQETETKVLL